MKTDTPDPRGTGATTTSSSSARLLYRRQFLLARQRVSELQDWNALEVAGLFVQAHPDLELCQIAQGNLRLVLLGCLLDADEPEKCNEAILKDIAATCVDINACILALKRYAGRYALIYSDGDSLGVIHDALALREVYYSASPNMVVCGSQPNLLVEFSNPRIELTQDPLVLRFWREDLKAAKWVGDGTCFKGVRHLLPNHYLDLKRMQSVRYWPSTKVPPLDLRTAVDRACAFLQGVMKSITLRHSVMLAVTSGTDSRTLLAASRELADRIYFFINNQGLPDDHPDIRIPKAIFERLGIPFHVHNVPPDVDDGFRKVFLNNTFFASERILPTIFNVYFKNHQEKVNVLGIGEIGRTRYGHEPKRLNGHRIAYALGYGHSRYAIKVGQDLLAEMLEVARESGVNLMTLLYWEQMLGNWGAVGNSESDIAMEEIDPFASHYLYELFLGVAPRHAKYGSSALFQQMIRTMWPELLEFPVNPPKNLKGVLKSVLKRSGMYGFPKWLRYQANHMLYVSRTKKW